MAIDQKFIDQFINVTSKAALASYYLVGKKDKVAADKAAVDKMRTELNKIDMEGEVVIGEGELDEAPMLFIGEKLGTKKGPKLDIAVDPLEGTNFVANNLPGALSVISVAEKSNLLNAPETYMNKISANVSDFDIIDLDNSVKKNIYNLAEYKDKQPSDLTACILDRPRHKEIINELKNLKVNLKLITDGDVSGVIYTVKDDSPVDMYLGIGGGPEGVLAAAALSCYDAQIQTRLVLDKDESIRAKKMGISDLKRKYNIEDMIKGDVMFCATAITSGDLLNGVKISEKFYETNTIALHKHGNVNTIYKNKYQK